MADCEYLGGCPFSNDKMDGMTAVADMMKKRYCHQGRQLEVRPLHGF